MFLFFFYFFFVCASVYITHEFVTWALNGVFYDNYDPKASYIDILNRNRLKDNSVRLICVLFPLPPIAPLIYISAALLFTSLILGIHSQMPSNSAIVTTYSKTRTYINTTYMNT